MNSVVGADLRGAVDLYKKAYIHSEENNPDGLKWILGLSFLEMNSRRFLHEYVWVVLCSGFSANAARNIEKKLWLSEFKVDLATVKHEKKRKAIEIALKEYRAWFRALEIMVSSETNRVEDVLKYIDSLPYMGPVTKYHLAKNIGFQVVKPDIHLTRLAAKFGFRNPLEMCEAIGKQVGAKVAVVDQVLWRYSADFGSR